jgi:hypothetical protein
MPADVAKKVIETLSVRPGGGRPGGGGGKIIRPALQYSAALTKALPPFLWVCAGRDFPRFYR